MSATPRVMLVLAGNASTFIIILVLDPREHRAPDTAIDGLTRDGVRIQYIPAEALNAAHGPTGYGQVGHHLQIQAAQ